jgi:hypothetical protein
LQAKNNRLKNIGIIKLIKLIYLLLTHLNSLALRLSSLAAAMQFSKPILLVVLDIVG